MLDGLAALRSASPRRAAQWPLKPPPPPAAAGTCLLALPVPLLQQVLVLAGGGAGGAARACRALAEAWRGALRDPRLAACYLIHRFGRSRAAQHVYGAEGGGGEGVLTPARLRGVDPDAQATLALALLRCLAAQGALPHPAAPEAHPLLRGAARLRHTAVVLQLLRHGAPAEQALLGACAGGHLGLVVQLLPRLVPGLGEAAALREAAREAQGGGGGEGGRREGRVEDAAAGAPEGPEGMVGSFGPVVDGGAQGGPLAGWPWAAAWGADGAGGGVGGVAGGGVGVAAVPEGAPAQHPPAALAALLGPLLVAACRGAPPFPPAPAPVVPRPAAAAAPPAAAAAAGPQQAGGAAAVPPPAAGRHNGDAHANGYGNGRASGDSSGSGSGSGSGRSSQDGVDRAAGSASTSTGDGGSTSGASSVSTPCCAPPPRKPAPPPPDHLRVVRLLLRLGADPRWDDSAALVWAARGGADALVQELLAAGADPRARGSRALVAAGEVLRLRVVGLLLRSGAYSRHDLSSVARELLVPAPLARVAHTGLLLVPWLVLAALLVVASTPVALGCVVLCLWNGLWVVSLMSLMGYGFGLAVVGLAAAVAVGAAVGAWGLGALLVMRFLVRAAVRRAALGAAVHEA